MSTPPGNDKAEHSSSDDNTPEKVAYMRAIDKHVKKDIFAHMQPQYYLYPSTYFRLSKAYKNLIYILSSENVTKHGKSDTVYKRFLNLRHKIGNYPSTNTQNGLGFSEKTTPTQYTFQFTAYRKVNKTIKKAISRFSCRFPAKIQMNDAAAWGEQSIFSSLSSFIHAHFTPHAPQSSLTVQTGPTAHIRRCGNLDGQPGRWTLPTKPGASSIWIPGASSIWIMGIKV